MNETNLIKILGEDNVKDMQTAIKDIILRQFEDELNDEYLVNYESIKDMIHDCAREIIKEEKAQIKKLLKDKILEEIHKEFE